MVSPISDILAQAGTRWPWQLIVLKIAIPLLLAWIILRQTLAILLSRFLHAHLHVGHVGWFSLNDIEWTLDKHSRPSTSTRIQSVHIRRIGWVTHTQSARDDDHTRLGWFGFAVQGIRVNMALVPNKDPEGNVHNSHRPTSPVSPMDGRNGHLQNHSPTKQTPHTGSRPKLIRSLFRQAVDLVQSIHRTRRVLRRIIIHAIPVATRKRGLRIYRCFRQRIVAPFLRRTNLLARSMGNFIGYFAIELSDVTVHIPQADVAYRMGLLRFGLHIERGHQNYVGAWMRFADIRVDIGDDPVTKADEMLPDGQMKTDASQHRSDVLSIPGVFLLDTKAHFDPDIGVAGLYRRDSHSRIQPRKGILDARATFVEQNLSKYTHTVSHQDINVPSIIIWYDRLHHTLERIRDSMTVRPNPHLGPHLKPHLHARTADEPARNHKFANAPMHDIEPRNNPIAVFRSLHFSLPMIKVLQGSHSNDPEDPLHVLTAALHGLVLKASLGATLSSDDNHVQWFGKQAQLDAVLACGFEKFDVDCHTRHCTGSDACVRTEWR